MSLSTAEKNELAFSVLSDIGSVAAKAFGISFDLAEELRPIYARMGHALPDKNGDESWSLPIPAVPDLHSPRLVVGRDKPSVRLFLDVGHSWRPEVEEVHEVFAEKQIKRPIQGHPNLFLQTR